MKDFKDILLEHENIYIWDDGTIDLCFHDKDIPFIRHIKNTKCLRCDHDIILGNEHKIIQITEYVKGIKLICNKCNLNYFLHMFVSMKSTTQ